MALEQLSLFYLLDEPGPVRVNEGWGRFRFGHVRRERQSPWWDHSAAHPSRKSREGWGTPLCGLPSEGWATRLDM